MAIVVVQVGQCGNQLGDELFSQLALIAGDGSRSLSAFFASDGKARCVLVDTEPKVVQGVRERHPDFIRRENVISGQSGRGNNWGLGYYGVGCRRDDRDAAAATTRRAFHNLGKDQHKEDDGVLTKALRAVHLETRRAADVADVDGDFEAIVLLHSLVGGTGSGLASRLAEKLRFYFVRRADDEWDGGVDHELAEEVMRRRDGLDGMLVAPRRARYLISVAVAPFSAGEMATQGFNAALTLHSLLPHVDALVLLRNDDTIGAGLLGESRSTASRTRESSGVGGFAQPRRCVTFKEANEVFVGLLLPIFHFGRRARATGEGCVHSLVTQCVAPGKAASCKLLTVVPTPLRSYEIYRATTLRCRFYTLHGTGKALMPGCHAEVPFRVLLRPSSLTQVEHDPRPTPLAHHPRRRCGARTDERRDTDTFASGSSSSSSASSSEADVVYAEVEVQVPPILRTYYQTLRGAPVASMYARLEGVLVLSQVRELNARLLFPLLRSAALKVRLGAFTTPYVDVGVTNAHIVDATRAVAAILSEADEG